MGVASMLCSALLLAAFQYPSSMSYDAWTQESGDPSESLQDLFRYGIAVDRWYYDSKECTLTFCTSLPPPYLVGLYTSDNAQFRAVPGTRARPICWKVVEEKRAAFRYDFSSLKANAFVQVMPACWTNYPGFRAWTPEELERHYATMQRDDVDWEHPVSAAGEDTWRPLPLWKWASQEVPIRPRTLRSLSVRDGRRIGLDWEGRLRVIEDDKAEPGRIYWEGLE